MTRAMSDEEVMSKIEELFQYLNSSSDYNIKMIESGIDCSWIGKENQTLLHILFSKVHSNYEKCIKFASVLLTLKVDPNTISDAYGGTFIQTAIEAGYPASTIYMLISLACKRGLNVNVQNKNGNTFLHSLIEDSNCSGYNILKIFNLIRNNGFDPEILNNDGLDILELFEASSTVYDNRTSKEFHELKRYVEEEIEKENRKKIETLENFGTVMNLIDFVNPPTVGRELEVEKLGIAMCQKNKSAILIGDSGVGKTSIVDQFAYDIQNDRVPSILRNKLILEVSPSELIAGKSYVGDFEKVLKELVEVCLDNDVILFIDEIHTLFGTGSHSNSNVDMAQILKKYLGRTPLKIIGTTTKDEYFKYFHGDALRRRFSVIEVKELEIEKLRQVIEKEIVDLGNDYLISPEKLLNTNSIDILLDLTGSKNLVYGNTSRNPDLVIGIIRSAYAKALYDESLEINCSHIEYGINECEALKERAKEEAIESLNSEFKVEKKKSKIIPFVTKMS